MPNDKRIIIFSICVTVPHPPTEQQNAEALAMICRVVHEGMKLDIDHAQAICMTEEQARANMGLTEASKEGTDEDVREDEEDTVKRIIQ